MKRAAYLLLFLIAGLLALCLSGCRSSKGVSDERQNAELVAPAVPLDTARTPIQAQSTPMQAGTTPMQGAGILSGIGHLFSTPEGRANRQAVKLAKASVPRSLGKGAVWAPNATDVVNAYKPKAAVVKADSGAIVTAIGKNKGPVAAGPNATATQTTTKPGFLATLGAAILGNLWLWLLALLILLYVVRKRLPFVGQFFA